MAAEKSKLAQDISSSLTSKKTIHREEARKFYELAFWDLLFLLTEKIRSQKPILKTLSADNSLPESEEECESLIYIENMERIRRNAEKGDANVFRLINIQCGYNVLKDINIKNECDKMEVILQLSNVLYTQNNILDQYKKPALIRESDRKAVVEDASLNPASQSPAAPAPEAPTSAALTFSLQPEGTLLEAAGIEEEDRSVGMRSRTVTSAVVSR